jgi:hypothetical protein
VVLVVYAVMFEDFRLMFQERGRLSESRRRCPSSRGQGWKVWGYGNRVQSGVVSEL